MVQPLYNRYVPSKLKDGDTCGRKHTVAADEKRQGPEPPTSPQKRKRDVANDVHLTRKELENKENDNGRKLDEATEVPKKSAEKTVKKRKIAAGSNEPVFGDTLLQDPVLDSNHHSNSKDKEPNKANDREQELDVGSKKKKKKKPRPSEIREARERAEKEAKEKAKAERAQKLAVREKKLARQSDRDDDDEGQLIEKKKHSRVFDRFQKAAEVKADQTHRQPGQIGQSDTVPDQHVETQLRDLEPIPMPDVPEAKVEKPAYALLPKWLSEPVRIAANAKKSFAECHVDQHFVSILSKNNFKEALPLQAGVLPLLIPSREQHQGDSLISALTGSGKTLSYVLPIIQSILQPLSAFNSLSAAESSSVEQQDITSLMPSKLRAVIVLPTRELVAQVESVVRMCTTGSRLKTGTALGSKNLKLEADSLVQRGMRYDPTGWEYLRSKFDIDLSDDESEESEDADGVVACQAKKDRISDVGEFIDLLPLHVPEYSSKVDVLVCTPGRLVEHIKTTPGFTLAHLEWLVIDEADQLLDQGFQEWVRTLLDAIDADRWRAEQLKWVDDGSFEDAKWHGLRGSYVRKVLLSATMTRDLDKLSSLKLKSPQLIIMEGQELSNGVAENEEQSQDRGGRTMTIPPTLEEKGVPVGDGSEKPLYLLAVLRRMLEDHTATISSNVSVSVKERVDHGRVNSAQKLNTSSSSSSSEASSIETESDSSQSDEEMLSPSASDPDSEESSRSSPRATNSSRASSPHQTNGELSPLNSHSEQLRPLTILIFASNGSSASRLQYLLRALLPSDPVLASSLRPSQITSLTKTIRPSQRRKLLASFSSTPDSDRRPSQAKCRILISTDLAARGLDIPHLSAVVSYDIPNSAGTYVHRVGRTARAGRQGRAWTLVAEREAGWFWKVVATGRDEKKAVDGAKRREEETIERAEGSAVKRVRVDVEKELGEGIKEAYAKALGELKGEVLGGKREEDIGDVQNM